MSIAETGRIVDSVFYAAGLEDVVRVGWERRGIPNPENVAEHTYGAASLFQELAPIIEREKDQPVDRGKIYDMIVTHDQPEVKLGDERVKYRGGMLDLDAKKAMDARQRAALITQYGEGHRKVALFDEFTAAETEEARIAQACDKFQMMFRALKYEATLRIDLSEFYKGHSEIIRGAPPVFYRIYQEILRRRRKIVAQRRAEARRQRLESTCA